jgi:hypothetical protein
MGTSLSLEFEPFINYECILCSFFPNTSIVNAACIGVHFTPLNEVFIHVYDDRDTKRNLIPGANFSINFSDNFLDYVIAALTGWNKGEIEPEFNEDAFDSIDPVPILKSSWACISCIVKEFNANMIPICKQREKPNIRADIIEKNVIRFPRNFNNRSFNLSLEALILTTKIPFLPAYSAKYNISIKYYKSIKNKIESWHDMDRFEQAYQMMDNFLINQKVRAYDIFD